MNILALVTWLKSLGNSIVTLSDGENTRKYDINSEGSEYPIGYEEGHGPLFMAHLRSIQQSMGVVVVRHFLKDRRFDHLAPNGKIISMPEKNIYMFQPDGDRFRPIARESVEWAQMTDADTGKRLPPEAGVHYCEYGLVNDSTR